MERKLVGPHLRLIGAAADETALRSSVKGRREPAVAAAKDAEPLLGFPSGSLSFGTRESVFREIGLTKGKPWSVDTMADAFRAEIARESSGERGCQDV